MGLLRFSNLFLDISDTGDGWSRDKELNEWYCQSYVTVASSFVEWALRGTWVNLNLLRFLLLFERTPFTFQIGPLRHRVKWQFCRQKRNATATLTHERIHRKTTANSNNHNRMWHQWHCSSEGLQRDLQRPASWTCHLRGEPGYRPNKAGE